MKNNHKLFIIVISMLLLSGCNIDYNLTIHSNDTIDENIKLVVPNSYIKEKNSNVASYIDDMIASYKRQEYYSGYSFNRNINKTDSDIYLYKNYKDLQSYANSNFANNLFENLEIVDDGKYVTFRTTGDYYKYYLYGREDDITEPVYERPMKDLLIKIKLENKVLDTNAYQKDEKNNIYTWKITYDSKDVSIYIKYSKEKRYDVIIKSFISEHLVAFIMSIILIGVIILFAIFVLFKYFIGNKV